MGMLTKRSQNIFVALDARVHNFTYCFKYEVTCNITQFSIPPCTCGKIHKYRAAGCISVNS